MRRLLVLLSCWSCWIPLGLPRLAVASDPESSAEALAALEAWLESSPDARGELGDRPFAAVALTRTDAEAASHLLWQDHRKTMREARAEEMESRVIRIGELEMPFFYKVFGEKPPSGRSLYFSMHGGGGAPARVNDQQWENQKRLYELDEGVYLVPRSPTNTWNMWHQGHIDAFFARLIENLVVFEDVNPDRVYIMGYSAGGDGVYQLAPRFSDRLAAAAMMAGHPNETSPLGLRNLPFTLHMGADDSAYNRNSVARRWAENLAALREDDPAGYVHWVEIHEGKGHWMDRQDAAAIPWMAAFSRVRFPERIVWRQDDVTHPRFYWLAVPQEQRRGYSEVTAHREGNALYLHSELEAMTVLLNDSMTDLDQPMTIHWNDSVAFEGEVTRTIRVIARTLAERGDPGGIYSGAVDLARPGTDSSADDAD